MKDHLINFDETNTFGKKYMFVVSRMNIELTEHHVNEIAELRDTIEDKLENSQKHLLSRINEIETHITSQRGRDNDYTHRIAKVQASVDSLDKTIKQMSYLLDDKQETVFYVREWSFIIFRSFMI